MEESQINTVEAKTMGVALNTRSGGLSTKSQDASGKLEDGKRKTGVRFAD